MRKLIAIIFFLLLLFSTGGYLPLISYLQQHPGRNLTALLQEDWYDHSRLVEIRINQEPSNKLEYTSFDHQYGTIEIGGLPYSYERKKTDGNETVFRCFPIDAGNQLKDMRYDLNRLHKEMTTPDSRSAKQQTNSVQSNLGDFDDRSFYSSLRPVDVIAVTQTGRFLFSLPDVFGEVPHAPPEC